MRESTGFLVSAALVLAGCSSTKFVSSALPNKTSGINSSPSDGANASQAQVFSFGLKIGSGAPVVGQATQTGLPAVYLNNATDALSGEPLNAWQSAVFIDGSAAGPLDAVKGVPLDFSKSTGTITVHANFAETSEKRTGTATASVFVDGEAPKPTLLRLSSSQGGEESQVFWSATDNYRLNEDVSVLIGCTSVLADLAPKSHTDLATLPDTCAVVYKGADLHKQPPQLTLGSLAIGATTLLPGQLHYALYIEDMVGLSAFTWITEPADAQALLTLATLPASAQYTNARHVPITLQLTTLTAGTSKQIDAASNSGDWPNYDTTLAVTKPTASTATAAFNPNLAVDLTGADGIYSFDIQVDETATGITSNHKSVIYVLDTTPPAVAGIKIDVPGGILNAQATINLSWTASDANGIDSQLVEIMQTGDTGYTKVGTIAGGQTTYSFPWGTRSNKGFVIRITATDPAGNNGVGVSAKWTPQVFNAAVLTSSVQCYFCHVKIVGDLGGINFPADSAIRSDSGTNFSITGNIYGTTTVPTKLSSVTAGSAMPYYANDTYKIFPKNNVFPVISAAKMIDSVTGSLTLGTLFINRVYQGNLVLDGTKANQPIQLSGEVFINGDLILKGSYKGVGTIYANNIYIVGDVVALKSPFPFADDPATATAQAVTAVTNKTDALYLGSLNQAVVGGMTTGLTDENGTALTNTDPFSWMPLASYNALGAKAVPMKNTAGVDQAIPSSFIPDPTDVNNTRAAIEVNRVDAYLYAQATLMWRSYGNILLNGGFMSPRGGIVSSTPNSIFFNSAMQAIAWANNPRNGLPPTQNVIRYDYRLRTGGAGFETIKSFFDQQ